MRELVRRTLCRFFGEPSTAPETCNHTCAGWRLDRMGSNAKNALMIRISLAVLTSSFALSLLAQVPAPTGLEKFHPVKAPEPTQLLLKPGDRLAICGDSITE